MRKTKSKTNSTFFMDIEENLEKKNRPGSIYRFVKKQNWALYLLTDKDLYINTSYCLPMVNYVLRKLKLSELKEELDKLE